MGAKALSEEAFDLLGIILNTPIEVEGQGGRFSNRSFIDRRDLFWPEAFLGYADLGMKYIIGAWRNHPHLHPFFHDEESYHFQVAMFLMTVVLAYETANTVENPRRPLYPGYRLFPQAQAVRAMSALCSRMSASPTYLEGIASTMGLNGETLRQRWHNLVTRANSAELGHNYWPGSGVRFPDPMAHEVEES
jgi:hypothetical protein